jgi:hypothetical protein
MANWLQTHGAVIGLALTLVLLCIGAAYSAAPPGFVSIFNGQNLDGGHIAEESRHGNSNGWAVRDSAVEGTQKPVGKGGIAGIQGEGPKDWGADSSKGEIPPGERNIAVKELK